MNTTHFMLYISLFIHFTAGINAQAQRRVTNRVQKAIDATKRRQSFHSPVAAVTAADKSRNNKSQQQRPVKTEDLDIQKLNQMIKAIDKSWVLPRSGSRDPVGSNFQAYKKTCATIYKSREGACQQVGFGVMCFNYCFEQGEQMSYKCQDISDSTYCKTNSNFESFLGKHKKDSYKVKAFIHQMISRCYATTVCSTTGIFSEPVMNKIIGNATTTGVTASPKEKKLIKANKKASTDIKASGAMQRNGKPNIWERFAAQQPNRQQATRAPEDTSNSGTIGPSPADPSDQPKMVPFWQRLLKRKKDNSTMTTTTQRAPETTTDPITEYPEEKEEEVVEEEVVTSTTTQATTRQKRRRVKQKRPKTTTTTTTEAIEVVPEETPEEEEEEYVVLPPNKPELTAVSKHTWKPLPKTFTSKPFIAAHSNLGEIIEQVEKGQDPPVSNHEPEGFWNKFQPGRWFQSIHYMTNTG